MTAQETAPVIRKEIPWIPEWLPEAAVVYLEHVAAGVSIREISRRRACHPSTISRQVRKIEGLREDFLIDEAIAQFDQPIPQQSNSQTEQSLMQKPQNSANTPDNETVTREARRILRRLCEKDACLLVSPEMDMSAVFKCTAGERPKRIAKVAREVARAFAVNEWISCSHKGKVTKYVITGVGRTALKRLIEQEKEQKFQAEDGQAFQNQHREFGERVVMAYDSSKPQRVRYNLAESPLTLLGRKRGKEGQAFLEANLIEAGERLREDFEVAQIGPKVAQNWESFLTGGQRGSFSNTRETGSDAARRRVESALEALGPGLGDVALRVCCYLEGLERAEKRLNWSARSGKVVLKIALQRLAGHYGIMPTPVRHTG